MHNPPYLQRRLRETTPCAAAREYGHQGSLLLLAYWVVVRSVVDVVEVVVTVAFAAAVMVVVVLLCLRLRVAVGCVWGFH